MTHSAWNHTLEMRLALVVSSSKSCMPLLVNTGMTSFTLIIDSEASASAMTSTSGRRYSRNPEFAVMNLSLHFPPYADEMNMISPHSATDTRFWPAV